MQKENDILQSQSMFFYLLKYKEAPIALGDK